MALEGLQLGQYRLLRLLGSGGMGEVYLAEDARINQQVAIKVSRAEASPYPHNSTTQDAIRLFQREAKAIARLDHPHILPLFSYGEENVHGTQLIYIVMPYRPEGSFAAWLQQRGENEMLSAQDVAYFTGQAAEALQYAHDTQIVHQDVKPSNFLLRANKEHPRLPDLLLADFGIARLSTSTSSVSHSIRGTPTYMAPEQWRGEPVYATDQYALAILAYELLVSRPPFAGRQEQVMYQHFNAQPQPPSMFNLQLSKDVDDVMLKALAKQPEERFPSIAAFAQAFRQATQGLAAPTISKPVNSSDLRATLAISKAEAQSGTHRILTLPGGRQVSVSVPAGAYDGQVLHLPGMGEPFDPARSAGTLILTLSVQETSELASPARSSHADRTIPASSSSVPDQTVLSSNRSSVPPVLHSPSSGPNVAENQRPQPGASQHGISTGTAILLVGLAFLLLIGGFGFFYLYTINHSPANPTNPLTTIQTRDTANPVATSTTQINNATSITDTTTPTVAVTPTSAGYVQLKSSYNGTASGYSAGSITFTLESEDQQGNLSMLTTFQQLGGSQKTASYSCQGAVTTDRQLNLQCRNVTDASYVLTVQGYVFPDGHMEGTETATNTADPSYNHAYSWKAY